MRFGLIMLALLATGRSYAADCSFASSGFDDAMKPFDDKGIEGCYEYTVCTGEGEKKVCTTHKICIKGTPDPVSKLGCMDKYLDKMPTLKDKLILTGPEIY